MPRRRWLQLTGSPAFELPPAGCAAGRSISRSCGTAPTGTGAHWGDHLHPVDDLRSRPSSSASQTAKSLSRNSSISPTPWPAGWAIHPRHPRPAGRRCRLRPVQCEGVRPSRRPGVAARRPGHRGSMDRLVRCRAVAHRHQGVRRGWWILLMICTTTVPSNPAARRNGRSQRCRGSWVIGATTGRCVSSIQHRCPPTSPAHQNHRHPTFMPEDPRMTRGIQRRV